MKCGGGESAGPRGPVSYAEGHWGIMDGMEERGLAHLPLSLLLVGEGQDLSLCVEADTCLVGEGQHTQR